MKKSTLQVLLLFPVLFLSFAVSEAQTETGFEISFNSEKSVLPISYRNGSNPIIPVMINGKGPFRFMFDTGSPGLIKVDESVAQQLNMTVVDSVRADDGSRKNLRVFPVVQLETVQLGNYQIRHPRAMVRNYNLKKGTDRIDGVIGVSYFPEVCVEVNFGTNLLTISNVTLEKDEDAFSINMNNGVPQAKVSIGSKEVAAVFDTGNMGLFTLHSSQISKDMMIGDPVVVGTARTVNNEFEVRQVQLKDNVRLGNLSFERPTVVINDLLPQANLGMGFLRQMDIAFDLKNNLARLKKVNLSSAGSGLNGSNELTGKYGDRTITSDNEGNLYVQRPGGMLLKMVARAKDEFGLERVPAAILKFERDQSGNVVALLVSASGQTWERVLRS